MELIERLLFGSESLWGGGVAHSVLILALVVALGVMLGKLKVAGVSLGVTGILFVGIGFSYFGMNVDEHLMHFLKEFGLILFVYSIGLQVGRCSLHYIRQDPSGHRRHRPGQRQAVHRLHRRHRTGWNTG